MVKPGDWQTHHLVAGGGPLPPVAAGAYAEPKACNTSKRTKEPQGPMNDSPPQKKKGNEESNPVNWSTFHTSQGPIHAIKRNFSRALGTKTIKQPPSVLPPLLSSLVHALLLPSSAWPSAPPSGLVLLSSQKPAISETYGYDISWQFDFSLHS